ncbi:MAG: pentapeptide repeat-containing protein [Phycisphaerales bacterium]|nr:pentapeptide repeat-containing protein [Phycisphaerales bacterium]
MRKTIYGLIFLYLCTFAQTLTFAAEKPTREQIIEFLEDYRQNRPLTADEKKTKKGHEIVDLVKRFGTDFTSLDLSGIDFEVEGRIVNVAGADFSNSNMQGVKFDGGVWSHRSARLMGCKFQNTDLTKANFYYSEFQDADFTDARLKNTGFFFCKMQRVLFADLDASACHIYGIDFTDAKLMNTDFSKASFYYGSDYQNADLSNANLSNTNQYGAKFRGANLQNANFTNAELRVSDFTGANLEGAILTGTNLYAAIFRDVQGIDEATREELEKHLDERRRHDFKERVNQILSQLYIPSYISVASLVLFFSIARLLSKKEKTRGGKLFMTALVINAFLLFSTLCTFLLIFSGGSSTAQFSTGNMAAWSAWLHFGRLLVLGMLISLVIVHVLPLISFVHLFWKSKRHWSLFFFLLLTLAHCYFAFSWLMNFAPTA